MNLASTKLVAHRAPHKAAWQLTRIQRDEEIHTELMRAFKHDTSASCSVLGHANASRPSRPHLDEEWHCQNTEVDETHADDVDDEHLRLEGSRRPPVAKAASVADGVTLEVGRWRGEDGDEGSQDASDACKTSNANMKAVVFDQFVKD